MATTKNTTKRAPKKKTAPKKHHTLKKWLFITLGVFVLFVLAAYIAFRTSPWPGALIIRYVFEQGGKKTSQALEKYVPSGVSSIQNEQYRPNDKDALLDVYYPNTVKNTHETLPTIVWIHGGAWISGSKKDVANYLKIIAAHGYTAVGVDYSIAPAKHYPTPLLQLNDALLYIQEHAERLHINPYNIVLAGDSAGSQIAAQMAALITNPPYASLLNIDPTLQPSQLRATILNCGAYDLALPDYNGEAGAFLKTVLWAYSGKKDFLNDPVLRQASVIDYVTADFPPTFITAGNADPLESQSREFAKKLQSLNVSTDTLFYPKDHTPKLSHEYQFVLDNADGKQALARILRFLNTQTTSQ